MLSSKREINKKAFGPTLRGGDHNKTLRYVQRKGIPRDRLMYIRMRHGMCFPKAVCDGADDRPCIKALTYWRAIRLFVTQYSAEVGNLPTLKQFKEGLMVNEEAFYKWGVCRSIHPEMIWVLYGEAYRMVMEKESLHPSHETHHKNPQCYYCNSMHPLGC